MRVSARGRGSFVGLFSMLLLIDDIRKIRYTKYNGKRENLVGINNKVFA